MASLSKYVRNRAQSLVPGGSMAGRRRVPSPAMRSGFERQLKAVSSCDFRPTVIAPLLRTSSVGLGRPRKSSGLAVKP